MVFTKKKATVEDYLKTPEGGGYQLIDGEIIDYKALSNGMATPSSLHQFLAGYIYAELVYRLKISKLGKICIAPFGVFLDEETVLEPDIFFIKKERYSLIEQKGLVGIPDLVIEILSPSTSYYDTKKKFIIYEKYQLPEYWIIDPEDGETKGYFLTEGKLVQQFQDTYKITSALLNETLDFKDFNNED